MENKKSFAFQDKNQTEEALRVSQKALLQSEKFLTVNFSVMTLLYVIPAQAKI